ncbi:regulatory protein, luxR family [Propionispora vibrioides]|uniref:Regulatory protein, luxR family n=2 Tax=Propionispora vibrioides TaxID=112903 RepID=A0A1H8XEU4_9FIRM|nr:regulatory protein, luxR family [Propionispora vibrioides]
MYEYLYEGLQFRPMRVSLQTINKLSVEKGIIVQQQYPRDILKDSALSEILNQNRLLISIVRPLLYKVFSLFSNKANLLLLTDANGYIIDLISSPEILLSCFNNGIMLGTCMDYFSLGTNAISLSKYEKGTISILGKEHFCHILQSFNCLATPINLGMNIIGFLDISTFEPSDLVHLSSVIFLLAELIKSRFSYDSYKLNFNNDKDNLKSDIHSLKESKITFFGKIIVNSNFLFTIKEIEILYEMYMKKSPADIVKKLCITSNTFKTHLRHIYQKLNVCTIDDCFVKIDNLLGLN